MSGKKAEKVRVENNSQKVAVAYCGPNVPGIASQYQVFTAGLPEQLQKAVDAKPALKALVVPVSKLAEVRKGINSKAGKWSALYKHVKEV